MPGAPVETDCRQLKDVVVCQFLLRTGHFFYIVTIIVSFLAF